MRASTAESRSITTMGPWQRGHFQREDVPPSLLWRTSIDALPEVAASNSKQRGNSVVRRR